MAFDPSPTTPTGDERLRGIVDPVAFAERFTLRRHLPTADLAWMVDRYWVVQWDLGDESPYDQQVIPFPTVNLSFVAGVAEIESVSTKPFVRRLEGRGQVLGVKFRPAGFRPLLGRAVSSITGARFAAADVFGTAVDDLAASLADEADVNDRVGDVDTFLRELCRASEVRPLPMTNVVSAIVETIDADRSVRRVDDLAERLGVTPRRLQRLFAEHIGLGPKWVLNRARMHDVVELAAEAEEIDWSRLAVELGFSDQSHLIREFRWAVGTSPTAYVRRVRGEGVH